MSTTLVRIVASVVVALGVVVAPSTSAAAQDDIPPEAHAIGGVVGAALSLTLGAGMVVAGAWWLAADDQCAQHDPSGRCVQVSTHAQREVLGGLGIAAGGVLLVGGALIAWYADTLWQRRARAARSSRLEWLPILAADSGAVLAGAAGRW